MTNRSLIATLAVTVGCAGAVKFEGLKTVAYYDPKHIPTICVGRTHGVRIGDTATKQQCMEWLGEEFTQAIDQASACVPPEVDLTPGQLAAFGDMVYNIGPTPICDPARSTLAKYLKQGKVVDACNQIALWDKMCTSAGCVALPGLTARRVYYKKVCLGEIPT